MKYKEKMAFLREYCCALNCGGRMYRHLIADRLDTGDDGGSAVLRFEMFDQCDRCRRVRYHVKDVHRPATALEEVFDKFNQGQMTRAEFDKAVAATLQSAGADWEQAVS